MPTNEEICATIEQLREKMARQTSQIIARLESFSSPIQDETLKDNLKDIKMIHEGCLLLQKEIHKFLAPESVAEKIKENDFSHYLKQTRHDLCNPINVIRGYTEIIIEELPDNPALLTFKEILSLTNEILSSINKIKFASPTTNPLSFNFDKSNRIAEVQPKQADKEFTLFKENFSILIVDDVRANCDILERYLNKIGYTNVQSVTDGFQALAISKRFNLVLLDIDMPGMNGIEVLLKLKEEIVSRRLMVLMISAADTLENVIECIKLGADDFLTKPFNKDVLKVRIEAIVEKAWASHVENVLRARIDTEKMRYEGLLHSIFPPSVVGELKETGHVETRNYPNVAILFADVVNFTPFCDTHDLPEIIRSLQEFAVMCETMVAKNNLQKIKTIGDSFLGVSGMLMNSENPVLDCIRCGQEFINETANLSSKWKLHIGIHYGTVIGGIVGKSQYLFDIWGDAVNTAARVQSMTKPNTIYLSKAAWDQVSGVCTGHSLGEMPVKGKKPIEIFVFEDFIH